MINARFIGDSELLSRKLFQFVKIGSAASYTLARVSEAWLGTTVAGQSTVQSPQVRHIFPCSRPCAIGGPGAVGQSALSNRGLAEAVGN